MATVLDLGLLEFFVPLFSIIFIFVILYAILQKSKLIGGKPVLDFFLSLMITLLVVLNSKALELANFLSVWFVVVAVIFVFLTMIFFMWTKEGKTEFPEGFDVPAILFWIAVIILVIGITQVFGPVFTPYAEDAPESWVVLRTLFHPRVIGALVLLWIVAHLFRVLEYKK